MIVAIGSFQVRNGFEEQVKQAFKVRPKLVENYSGLETTAADFLPYR